MRLGAYPAMLAGNSVVRSIYGADQISERHRHRYEVNVHYKDALEEGGLVFSGMSPDGALPEIVERPDHPWFIGVQFHPELKSKPFEPAPACSPASSQRPCASRGSSKPMNPPIALSRSRPKGVVESKGGVQLHPELKSKPFDPHPLFASFVEAAVKQSRLV